MCPLASSADCGDLPGDGRMHQAIWASPFPDDNHNARPLSGLVVLSQSHEYRYGCPSSSLMTKGSV